MRDNLVMFQGTRNHIDTPSLSVDQHRTSSSMKQENKNYLFAQWLELLLKGESLCLQLG